MRPGQASVRPWALTTRIAAARATPSMPGMNRSSRMTSNSSPALISASAASADSTSRTLIDQRDSCAERMRRFVALSSTISARLPPRSIGCLTGTDTRDEAGAVCSRTASLNVEPWPGFPELSAMSDPSIASARRLLMARPRPVPPYRRAMDESAWLNDWKSRPIWFFGMPMPVSRTATRSSTSSPSTWLSTETTTSPFSVNFTAFDSRLRRIWRSRPRSPTTAGGRSFFSS